VDKYVRHDFEQLKIKYGNNPSEFKKQMKKIRPRHVMRVRSQKDVHRSHVMKNEMKPKTMMEIKREEQSEFNIKLCDMGNACYTDKHYSDLI
jgi:hypothetical protein